MAFGKERRRQKIHEKSQFNYVRLFNTSPIRVRPDYLGYHYTREGPILAALPSQKRLLNYDRSAADPLRRGLMTLGTHHILAYLRLVML